MTSDQIRGLSDLRGQYRGHIPGRGQRRGSVIILVTVVIVIVALLGVTYLAMARIDRLATRAYSAEVDNMDAVIASIIALMQQRLSEDIFDDGNKAFSQTSNVVDGIETGADEPNDYPWTNSAVSYEVFDFSGSSLGNAEGGADDDMHLAATMPTDLAGNVVWPHITNLTGVFLRLPHPSTGSSTGPLEMATAASSGGNSWRYDTNVRSVGGSSNPASLDLSTTAYDTLGADADSDGIRDSKWTWAPLAQVGETQYIFAARLKDLSARVNPIASVYTGGTTVAQAPRWWYPGDLDADAVLGGPGEMSAWIAYLFNQSQTGISDGLPTTAATRDAFWSDAGGPYQGMSGGLSNVIQNAYSGTGGLELLYSGGLNRDSVLAEIENHLNTLLRQDGTPTDEDTYTDVPGVTTIQQYFTNNVRLRAALHSGVGQLAPAQHGVGASSKLRIAQMWSTTTAVADAARDAFRDLLKDDDMPFEIYAATTVPYGGIDTAADQLVASVVDFFDGDNSPQDGIADADSTITEYNGRYGMEALPFLSEGYISVGYELTTLPNVYEMLPIADPHPAFAIELFNPFSSRVRNLAHIRLRVITSTGSDFVAGDLATLSGITTLEPRKGIILLRDTGGKSGRGNVKGQIGYTLPSGWVENYVTFDLPFEESGVATLVTFELEVQASDGTWVKYSRVGRNAGPWQTDFRVGSRTYTINQGGALGQENWWQRTARANVTGLNLLSVRCSSDQTVNDFTFTGTNPDFTASDPGPIAGTSTIGSSDQTKSGQSLMAPWSDGSPVRRYAFDDVAMTYPTDVFRVMWVGPTASLTYAEVFRTATASPSTIVWNTSNDHVRSRMMRTNDANATTTGNRRLPRAQLMMDRIITVPVLNSTTPIYGAPNLNTIPQTRLDDALPLANATLRAALVSKIIAMRDSQTLSSRNGETVKGIASMGELLQLVDATPNGSNSIDSLARDGGYTPASGVLQVAFNGGGHPIIWSASDSSFFVDENGDGSRAAGEPLVDPAIDGRDEEIRLAGFLANVASVRSDFYVAYVTVRGYPAADWRTTPTEAARFVVVFDRSNVSSSTDNPSIVAFARLE